MEYFSYLHGPFLVIGHTAEGEFIYSRHGNAAARDTAFSKLNADLDRDVDMVASGAPHTLYFSDDVIRFTKRDEDNGVEREEDVIREIKPRE